MRCERRWNGNLHQGTTRARPCGPLTVAELNRQFPHHSRSGTESTNPYTYGDWKDPRTGEAPGSLPGFFSQGKELLPPQDPGRSVQCPRHYRCRHDLSAPGEGWIWSAISGPTLPGTAGVPYFALRGTQGYCEGRPFFPGDVVFKRPGSRRCTWFSPTLHHEVKAVVLNLNEVVLSFDYANEPVETIDVKYRFQRETGRLYTDGRLVKSSPGH